MIKSLSLSLAVLMISAATFAADGPAARAAVKIPTKSQNIISMRASADGNVVTFGAFWTTPDGGKSAAWVYDARAGKLSEMTDAVRKKTLSPEAACDSPIPSPDRNYVVLPAVLFDKGRPTTQIAYLMHLPTGQLTWLGEGMPVKVAWSNQRVYVSAFDKDGNAQPVREVDPATGRSKDLPVRGLLLAADPTGVYLVCACDAADPAKPMSRADMRKAAVTRLTTSGPAVRRICMTTEMSEEPVFSADGKRLAFRRQQWEDPAKPPKMLDIEMHSIDGKLPVQFISANASPVGVTDAGEVIALLRSGKPSEAPSLVLYDAAGKKPTTLAASAVAAVPCDGSEKILYLPGGDQPELKTAYVRRK